VVNGIQLVNPRQALPNNMLYRSIFPFPVFNAVQSKCFDSVYGSSDNLVVSAPTGSGKTAIFELAICRVIADKGRENIKIVYQAPTKALCSERARDWQTKFSALKLQCAELTGDTSQAQMRKVGSASIIVTTPEKWDSITRKWHDHRKLLQLVGLFLIDEVHILKDIRGATLEAVVSRMKSIGTDVRFVALSATIPNSEDIATWLGQNHKNPHIPARRETFGDEFRPVKLERHVFGFEKRMNDHAFDRKLDTKLPALLAEHTCGKPILVFCFTRKSCENTAVNLAEWWSSLPSGKPWAESRNFVRFVSRELQELVKTGVAFHHAGLVPEDRQAIEQAFLKGELSVICCTSTLAVGVNLPCHTVVLKGTVTYQNDAIRELSDLEALQMLGRAGRPQFDDSANALILTSSDQKERYQRMVSGEEILESTLHVNLIEHLNSEIGLRTISDKASAKKWLAGTFLSVRMRKNPNYYRLTEASSAAKDTDAMLEKICERDIKLLQEYNIITKDQDLKQTEHGASMSRYMVEFSTMKLLLGLPKAMNMEQLVSQPKGTVVPYLLTVIQLHTLARANEFREFKFKPADGPIFRDVNKSPFILYPIDENITKTWHKVSLVVQLHLGGADYPDSSESQKQRQQLRIEKRGIFERLRRLVRCVAECKGHDGDSISTKTALELARSLAADAWEGRPSELLQIPNIGPVFMRKLISHGVKTVKELVYKDPGEVAGLLGRNPTFGKTLSDHLKNFPLLGFDLAIPSRKHTLANGGRAISVPLVATLRCLNQTGLPSWNGKVPSVTFLAEITTGSLVYFWKGYLDKIQNDTGLQLPFSAEITARDERIVCHFSCEEIVGTIVTKSLDHNVPASVFKQLTPRIQGPEAIPRTKPSSPENNGYTDQSKRIQSADTPLSHGLDDADAIEAAAAFDEPTTGSRISKEGTGKTESQKSSETSYSDGDFPLIEDIIEAVTPRNRPPQSQAQTQISGSTRTPGEVASEAETIEKEPVKLPNGKWQCNHACTGGAPTKAGKRCSHRCCLEGLDKPRKIKPKEAKAAEPKKRKADGISDQGVGEKATITGSAGSGDTPAKVVKKRKLAQQSPSAQGAPESPWKPASLHSSDNYTEPAQFDESKYEHIDLSNIDDDDYGEFPDLAGLAARKTKGKASGASSSNAVQYSISSSMDEYMPSAPPGATMDFGDLDDDFGDDFDFDFGFGMASSADDVFTEKSDTTPAIKKPIHTDGAFRLEGKDSMLPDIARPAPLTPESYNEALQEAARLCDIDQNNMDTAPIDGDLGFDIFDEGLPRFTHTSNTTPADDNPAPQSPGTAAAVFSGAAGLGGAVGGGSPAGTPTAAMKREKLEDEPSWVQGMDQDFVDSFRGYVDFI